MSSLQQQLHIRPSTKEVTQLVDSKLHQQLSSQQQQQENEGNAVTTLRAEITQLRHSIERRATVHFVEDSLKRKVNKADLPHHLQAATATGSRQPVPTFSDLMQVSDELKTKIERVERKVKTTSTSASAMVEVQQELVLVREDLVRQLDRKAEKGAVEKVRVACCVVLCKERVSELLTYAFDPP